ncbi:hypothetical protein BKA62DRAFT_766287 [Auriculariales sp. MPI-PUGE-AT-0066]|nr:hypothetical protein BKA62DRAFT_766287 [Auriculariales sp. MPI-PUGE-AT-0066]
MLVFALSLAPAAAAALWPISASNHRTAQINNADQIGTSLDLTESERLNILPSSSAFTGLPRTSDCFRTVSTSLVCEVLELDEAARVKAAISFTLCELSTARGHAPPLECRPFEVRRDHSQISEEQRYTCVEALQRSVQFWSSYSGYLQRVSLHCFAFRAGSEIDTAKALYANATHEKIALLGYLQRREMEMERRAAELQTLMENLREVTHMLHVEEASINSGVELLRRASEQTANNVALSIQSSIAAAETALSIAYRTQEDWLLQTLSRVAEQHERSLIGTVSTADQKLHGVVEALSYLASEQQAASEHALTSLIQQSGVVQDRISNSATVRALEHSPLGAFAQAVQAFDNLLVVSTQLSRALSTHMQALVDTDVHLNGTKQNVLNLSHGIKDLTKVTNMQLLNVNATAAAIRQELHAAVHRQHHAGFELWNMITSRLVAAVLASQYGSTAGLLFGSASAKTALFLLRGVSSFVCSSAMVPAFYDRVCQH